MQCSQLTRNELDLALLGQISALLSSDPDSAANNPTTNVSTPTWLSTIEEHGSAGKNFKAAWDRYNN